MSTKFIVLNKQKSEKSKKHFNYCKQNNIPYVKISPKYKYSVIEYDLITLKDEILNQKDALDNLLESLKEIYKKYASDKKLPDKKYSFLAGNSSGCMTVFKDDQKELAELVYQSIVNSVIIKSTV